MNIKTFARQFKPFAERPISTRDKFEGFVEDVRLLDNTEVDLDPRSDRVLFLKKNRFWQPKSRTEIFEYSLNPRGTLGLRETVHRSSSSQLLWAEDLTAISYEQQGDFRVQRDFISVSKGYPNTQYSHTRNNGDPDVATPPDEEIINEFLEDSLLAKTAFADGSLDLLDRLEELEDRIPKGGWETPTPHWASPLPSRRDYRIDQMVSTALLENRSFGSPKIKESVDGYGSSAQTQEKIVKRGRTEADRSQYRSVQKYWRSTGKNHTGLDRQHDWSDAFISFLHKGSNLTNPIQKKRGAEELIDTAFADNQPWNFEFKGHEYKEREPRIPLQKGDLLVRKSEDGRKLDLVTSVGHRTMEVISGDYNDSVVKREVPLDTDGTPQDENRYPGFLRLE